MKNAFVAATSIMILGCAPSATTIPSDKGQTAEAHNQPVCLLKTGLPANISYTVLGNIQGGSEGYDRVGEIIPLMAQEARKLGADAVINMETGRKVGLFAWSRPYGTGTAVRVKNKADLNCASLGGELR